MSNSLDRHSPPHQRVALTRTGQAEHHAAGYRLLLGREAREGRLRQSRNGAAEATSGVVGRQGQPSVLTGLPQLQERRRQQRQGARLLAGVPHQRLGQPGLDPEAHLLRRLFDDLGDLGRGDRSHQHMVGRELPRQGGIGGPLPILVGADCHDDLESRPRSGQQLEERVAAIDVGAGEHLLELIDDQQKPLARGLSRELLLEAGDHVPRLVRAKRLPERDAQLGHRPLAWSHQYRHPRVATGKDAAGEGRHEAGSERRGLATP